MFIQSVDIAPTSITLTVVFVAFLAAVLRASLKSSGVIMIANEDQMMNPLIPVARKILLQLTLKAFSNMIS